MELLEEDSGVYLDEVAIFLREEFGIECSVATVSRCLARLRISNKRVERVHPERECILRAVWRAKLCSYKASQIVVVDESASNERTQDRKRGWSPIGIPCGVTGTAMR